MHVVDPGYNMGLAPAWNLAIRANSFADWWVLAQNDILLEPGSLAQLDVLAATAGDVPDRRRDGEDRVEGHGGSLTQIVYTNSVGSAAGCRS